MQHRIKKHRVTIGEYCGIVQRVLVNKLKREDIIKQNSNNPDLDTSEKVEEAYLAHYSKVCGAVEKFGYSCFLDDPGVQKMLD